MSIKARKLFNNFSYSFISNLVVLLVSTIVILVIPKLIGAGEYGYFQLYLFYSAYVGFLHFGWNDGIYLRYGGEKYVKLNKRLFFSQFYMLLFTQFLLGVMIFIMSHWLMNDGNRAFVIQMVAFALIIVNSRYMLVFILQATNRIKEYSFITLLDRISFVILIILILILGIEQFQFLILADIFGKFLSLVYAMYCCKEIVFNKASTFIFSVNEAIENINVGIKLMLANLSGILIVGTVRFGIERSWDITTFGHISLIISITNFMLIFINSIGIILFPILRRTQEKNLISIYSFMREILVVGLLGGLILYYPFKLIISGWLPEYNDSLIFLALLFPMFLYEGKMVLLVNTYLKVLRSERLLLKINIITLIFSGILTLITTRLLGNVNLAVFSIVLLLAFRCIIAEFYLSKILAVNVRNDIILELIMTFIFISIVSLFVIEISFFIYIIAYLSYVFFKRRDINSAFYGIKQLIKT